MREELPSSDANYFTLDLIQKIRKFPDYEAVTILRIKVFTMYHLYHIVLGKEYRL